MRPRFLVLLTNLITSAVSSVVVPVCCEYGNSNYLYDCEQTLEDPDSVFTKRWKNHDVRWRFNESITCENYYYVKDDIISLDGKGNLNQLCSDETWCCGNPCKLLLERYCMEYENETLQALYCGGVYQNYTWSEEETLIDKLQDSGLSNSCAIISISALIVMSALILTDDTESQKDYNLYLVSQSIAQVAMLITSKISVVPRNAECWHCLLKGYSILYFGLATFFCMNATSIRSYMIMRSTNGTKEKLQWHQFKIFSLYAWGTPLLISAITYSLQMSTLLDGLCSLKPDIGIETCFLQNNIPVWTYFYGPITVLIVANSICYALIASIIAKLYASQKRLHIETTGFFSRYTKLFLITGIAWIADVINWAFLEHQPGWLGMPSLVADTIVHLQGFFIFYFFVVQNKVLFRKLLHIMRLRVCLKKKIEKSSVNCSFSTAQRVNTKNTNDSLAVKKRVCISLKSLPINERPSTSENTYPEDLEASLKPQKTRTEIFTPNK